MEGNNYPLQVRLFPLVFLMVVEGSVNGLVQTLGASLIVGTGEGPILDIPGLAGNWTTGSETYRVVSAGSAGRGVMGGCVAPHTCCSRTCASSCRRYLQPGLVLGKEFPNGATTHEPL